jgi:hypothetical protein
LQEHPAGAGVCASCHAPGAAPTDALDLREVKGVASQGVHCDLCHKIADVGDGKGGLNFGRFNLRLLRPREGQLFFGPLDDVDRGEDAFAPVYRESRYCATCHEGVVFGVHVYSTYSEWLQSPARRQGRHCQDCHMTPTGRMTNVAPGHGGIERPPKTLANHTFFRGSQTEMLRRCLELGVSSNREKDRVRVSVGLRPRDVGHRVPTGFPDRQLLLIVEGWDAGGKLLQPRSGPRLPGSAGPDFGGKPGRLFARLLRDERGKSPVPFWRAVPEMADTRLIPEKGEEIALDFPPGLARLRARVLYRRFWAEVIRGKGWPDRDEVVAEVIREASGGR